MNAPVPQIDFAAPADAEAMLSAVVSQLRSGHVIPYLGPGVAELGRPDVQRETLFAHLVAEDHVLEDAKLGAARTEVVRGAVEHLALMLDVLEVRVGADFLHVSARLARQVRHPDLLQLRPQGSAEGEHTVAGAKLKHALGLHVKEAIDSRIDPMFDGAAWPEFARV